MKKIQMEKWERKSHYEWFSQFADPTVGCDVKMDVTSLLKYCKEKSLSSYAVIMYIVCECINSNQACRLRILNNEVVEIEKANVAYTIMTNENCFVNCRASLKSGFADYMKDVISNQQKYNNKNFVQKEFNNTIIIDDIYCSCVPWVDFLSVKQPIPDKSIENKSIPRACWGKYHTENDVTYMTLNILVNHALADGRDLANVFNDIQKAFNDAGGFIEKRSQEVF